MSLYTVDPADIKSVADAIREKTGESGTMTLRDMPEKIAGISGGGGTPSVPDDGKTRIYIHLEEERKSPMLGCCPNGTVTVDWGDGTQPDILTGTSITSVKWTPTHNYEEAGDYVISLTVEGEMGLYGYGSTNQYSAILRHSKSADARNQVYQNSVLRVDVGENITEIGGYSFYGCFSLRSVTIPDGVHSIYSRAFYNCYSLRSVDIPSSAILRGDYTFNNCHSLAGIEIPEGNATIFNYNFSNCESLTKVVFPASLTAINDRAFFNCSGVRCFDFAACTSVPELSNTNAFTGTASDCQFLVPSALYDEWIAATNWTTYASKIVAV